MRLGFTLVELLVVVLIIGLVSVVALPTVLPALSHRQVSEAARILQGALVGARDQAIHDGQPSGIRLLPDPQFSGLDPATGMLSPHYALAFNRIIPIGPAPDYTEGRVNIFPAWTYPAAIRSTATPLGVPVSGIPCLVVEEAVLTPKGAPNSPTSWFWNVRVGDKIQFGGTGPWYTIAGPMAIPPTGATINGTFYANAEAFVNNGPPGASLPVMHGGSRCEYLLLANGRDDNGNGWIDEGFDGVDNNGNGVIDEQGLIVAGVTYDEWEAERWHGGAAAGLLDATYSIRRRPMPLSSAREVALPSDMVIDATTWGYASPERSRIPVEQATGAVDLMVNPDGTAYFSGFYGSPAKFGMASAFVHLWLAERQDVADIPLAKDAAGNVIQPPRPVPIETIGGVPHYLPIQQPADKTTYAGPTLQGQYALLTLFSRTGQVVVTESPAFDDPLRGSYNPNLPFLPVQQGQH